MVDLESNTRARRVEPVHLTKWVIFSPDSNADNYLIQNTIADTEDGAWERCRFPAFRREDFEESGYMARKVKLTIEVVE